MPYPQTLTSTELGYATFRTTELSNTAIEVSATQGNVYGWNFINPNTSDVFIKFYDEDATVGTSTPIATILVPSEGTNFVRVGELPQIDFDTKIEMAATTGSGDSDATAPTEDLIGNLTIAVG